MSKGNLNPSDQSITEFLETQSRKEILRFITCGSVDDGKSTLIGRLLFESKAIFDDQLASIEADSRQYGTQGEKIDLALLVDGLQAEREQGITIDVAYRFFSTDKRRYIVADTPGHEQYTRNMATGASTADVAIILIDARKGVLTQTRRHSRIVALMGIRTIILAINKMDLVGYSAEAFEKIRLDYINFSDSLNFTTIQAIPLSGLEGDNVVSLSKNMDWYRGPSLIECLDTIKIDRFETNDSFRMPVQLVNRPHLDFRGFSGRIASGAIQTGDTVIALPSGTQSKIKSIIKDFGVASKAQFDEAVTLTLENEIDISRGDVLCSDKNRPEVADQFEAKLLWMSEHPMTSGRQYFLKISTKEVTATILEIKYREDVNTGAQLAAKTLELNGIASVKLSTSFPIVFEPYKKNKQLGSFILIDKLTYETVGAGMIDYALRRSKNIHWQELQINQQKREIIKHQKAKCIWLTGLSGSGKSTIANLLESLLHSQGKHTYILDGDNIRHGLNRDLGFTEADRVENIRRVAEVARLMTDAGLIVIVSFISPFKIEREMARDLFPDREFIEVFVDTPLEECEKRDVKGLYKKARAGDLLNFTGIDSPYERPENPEIHLHTTTMTAAECAEMIVKKALS